MSGNSPDEILAAALGPLDAPARARLAAQVGHGVVVQTTHADGTPGDPGDVATLNDAGSGYVAEAPSGGGSSLQVIGPFAVHFDDSDLSTQQKLADLAAGTLVLKTFGFIVTPWAAAEGQSLADVTLTIGVGGSAWADGDWWNVAQYDPTWNLQDSTSAVEMHLRPSGDANAAMQKAALAKDAGALIASLVVTGTPVAGEAAVYALVLPPA